MTEERISRAERPSLGVVTTSELSRSSRKVLERVARGERLVVFRHQRPVATLQPLDGVVVHLQTGVRDIYGEPVGTPLHEAAKLGEVEQALLTEAIRDGRFLPMRLVRRYDLSTLMRSIEQMGLEGLAQRTERGWELRGRGMVLREALLQRAAR